MAATPTNLLELRSVTVKNHSLYRPGDKKVDLGAEPENVVFNFGFITNASRSPVRLSCKLDGVDQDWNMGGGGEMGLVVRFYNQADDIMSHVRFTVHDESPGWQHSIEKSPFTHRREILMVPPGAAKLMIVLSSAGPQSAEGIYLLTGLSVMESRLGGENKTLIAFPERQPGGTLQTNPPLEFWQRDGTSPTMARMLEVGPAPRVPALAICDDDPIGHAEWHNAINLSPVVMPGDQLVVEWNEMYSIGDSAMHYVPYGSLAPGKYTFRVAEMDLYGNFIGGSFTLPVLVPVPFWRTIWFWSLMGTCGLVFMVGTWRYAVWMGVRREIHELAKQRLLEQERLRIARDIHDD